MKEPQHNQAIRPMDKRTNHAKKVPDSIKYILISFEQSINRNGSKPIEHNTNSLGT